MKNRFVLLIDNATKEQQNTITNLFKSKGLGYWHWYSDAWLLTDASLKWDQGSIRDLVQEYLPGVDTLVIKVESAYQWAGFGKKEKFAWLHESWPDK